MKTVEQKPKIIGDLLFLGATIAAAVILLLVFPQKREVVIATSRGFLIQMILILPAVVILIGLFAVFVPKDTVVRYLGKTAGIGGNFIALLLGALPTGPLYVAFPMASALLKKGARISNVIIFLSAWGCIKIPQELVELQFLGLRFMAARLILTITFVIAMGKTIEWMMTWKKNSE